MRKHRKMAIRTAYEVVMPYHLHMDIMFGSQSLFMAIFSFRSITNIYHKEETSEHSVFLFSMVCSKAFFGDACLDVLPKVDGAVSPESFPAFNR